MNCIQRCAVSSLLEDKEQTETVLNTFFLTDEKTVAQEKKIQILQQDISTEELFESR